VELARSVYRLNDKVRSDPAPLTKPVDHHAAQGLTSLTCPSAAEAPPRRGACPRPRPCGAPPRDMRRRAHRAAARAQRAGLKRAASEASGSEIVEEKSYAAY